MTKSRPTQGDWENLISDLLFKHFQSTDKPAAIYWTSSGPKVKSLSLVKPEDKVFFRCLLYQFTLGFTSKQWELIGSLCNQFYIKGKADKL